LRLKIFSDEDIPESFVNRLHDLMKLDNDKLVLVFKQMVISAHLKQMKQVDFEHLRKELDVDDKTLSRYLTVVSRVISRILSGKDGLEIQQDLIAHGFPQEKVEFLFSSVNSLEQSEKDEVRFWTLEGETTSGRNHLHAANTQTDLRSIVDNGYFVAILPVSTIRLRVRAKDEVKEQIWTLEPTSAELDFLMKILESARQELDSATKELKNRLGNLVLTTSG